MFRLGSVVNQILKPWNQNFIPVNWLIIPMWICWMHSFTAAHTVECPVTTWWCVYFAKVLLRCDKGVANYSDRTLLKNLGHWLGLLTLAKNKPILFREMDVKGLVYESYHKGAQELLYVIPFVAKIIESAAKSRVCAHLLNHSSVYVSACVYMYSVSQKKRHCFGLLQLPRTSTDFDNFWQKCC